MTEAVFIATYFISLTIGAHAGYAHLRNGGDTPEVVYLWFIALMPMFNILLAVGYALVLLARYLRP